MVAAKVVVVVVVVVVVCAKKLRRGMCVDGLGAREFGIMDSVYVDYGNPNNKHILPPYRHFLIPRPACSRFVIKSASCH
jgi:hypothetical protein